MNANSRAAGRYVRRFDEITSGDVAEVGGKNASLGEMLDNLGSEGIAVPDGFATTTGAYRRFVEHNDLADRLGKQIDALHSGVALHEVGTAVRDMFLQGEIPDAVVRDVLEAYRELAEAAGRDEPEVAVRSSATAEDLPQASFAGQQETYLNVKGPEALLQACRRCYASLFTDRAISYREHHGFDHLTIALSIGVQLMVRSDLAGAGVMFTVDTETGFPHLVVTNAAWGLGESVVSGSVDPDEYLIFKPLLDTTELTPIISKTRGSKYGKIVYDDAGGTRTVDTEPEERSSYVLGDEDILTLARWAARIEEHYGRPMDVEWAKDGISGRLYVVQARPETVQTRRESTHLRTYRLKDEGKELVRGLAIGDAIATGPVCKLESATEIQRFVDGAVLVTGTTDPDWEPIMKRAAGMVTDHGGRTSHAAIVSRELGVPALVGTGDATEVLQEGQQVTVSCAGGDEGHVYLGALEYEQQDLDLSDIPATRTKVMLNLASPAAAARWWRLPADGVGLARIEFIVNNQVRVHPMALVEFDALETGPDKDAVAALSEGYEPRSDYFVEKLAYGVARIAASRFPDPVVVRLSDFKTNEYSRLLGGRPFEPHEENPMIGWRGASRYYSDRYREGFALECAAMRRVRDEMGLSNVVLMIPFCRSPDEADRVLEEMARNGLSRGRNGLEIYVMAEIPANIILAGEFAERFDGFSIGSNDLTQLTLGVDRDSEALADIFDERSPAVTRSIGQLIEAGKEAGVKVGLCGQKPSDDPGFARLLVDAGIDSISVTPDSFLRVKRIVAEAEADSAG